MKKSVVVMVIMVLVIGIFGGVVNAASASVSASSKTIEIGNTVKITVFFGQKVSAAQFTLNFDTSKLEYVSKSGGGLFSASTKRYGYNSEDGVTADLASVTFTFKTKAAGTAKVSVSGLKISTETQTGISASMENSSVSLTIKEKEVEKPATTPSTGGTTSGNNNGGSSSNNTNSSSNNSTNKNNNTSSNKNNTASSNKNNSTTNKTETKKEEKKEETKQEENTIQTEVVPEETKQEEKKEETNKLIKIEDENAKKLVHEETKVMIKAEDIAIEEGTSLTVKIVNDNDEVYKQISDIMKKVKGNKTYFDVQLIKDDKSIQPNGYVTVFLPIPEGYNKERIELYYINTQTGEYELQNGEIQGEYYSFTTNHFLNYVLIEKPEPKTFGQIVTEIFTNLIVLYSIIGILVVVVIGETIVIIKLNNKSAKRSK